jgi:hypothetical protein
MARRLLTVVGVVLAAYFCGVIALLLVGGLSGGSCGCTLATGRAVSVHSDGWSITLGSTADTASIQTCGSRIIVAPTQLKVDGQLWSAIDAATKSVDVNVKDGAVEFIADGRLVPRKNR